jgi:hypothetical protein
VHHPHRDHTDTTNGDVRLFVETVKLAYSVAPWVRRS